MSHRRLTAVAVAGLATTGLMLASPAAALAAPHTPVHRAVARRPAPHRPAPRPVHFAASGLVVGHTTSGMQVLVRDLHLGSRVVRNQVVTVRPKSVRQSRMVASELAAPPVGDVVEVDGDSNGSVGDLEVVHEVVKPAPAKLFLGVIHSVNGSFVVVDDRLALDGSDATKDAEAHQLTVDVASAGVTVDGAPGTLAPGQFVAILGERDDDTVLASSVAAYSTAPDMQSGMVTGIDGNTVTLATGEGQDEENGGDQAPAAAIDLSTTSITLNGTSGASASQLAVGDTMLVFGTSSNGTFTPSSAYAFNKHDDGPVGDNDD